MSQNSLSIDDEGSSEGNSVITSVVNENSIVLGYLFGYVGDQWNLHVSETSLLSWLHAVLHMGELRVDGASNDLTFALSELLLGIAESNDLSWAHKCEI